MRVILCGNLVCFCMAGNDVYSVWHSRWSLSVDELVLPLSSSCHLDRVARGIEVFHTRDQNHVTAGANPFWGSSFAAAAVGAVDMLSKLAANPVKRKQAEIYKQNVEAAGISYPCDLPSNFILHINKYARFDENTKSLLGYTDIVIYVMFNWSYCISMAINAFKNRESYVTSIPCSWMGSWFASEG